MITNNIFTRNNVTVASASQVKFDVQQGGHTMQTVSTNMADLITATKDPGGDPATISQAVPNGQQRTVTINGVSGGEINYQCGIHGATMAGRIKIA